MKQLPILNSRATILAGLMLIVSGCGVGSAAVFSSASSDDDEPPLPLFEAVFGQATPQMFVSPNAAGFSIQLAASQRFIELPFTRLPAAATLQASDFALVRFDEEFREYETVTPIGVSLNSGLVVIELDTSLALGGVYHLRVVGDIRDLDGQGLSGPTSAFAQVGNGEYSEVQAVAFGNVAAGGIQMGGRGRVFTSLEADLGGGFFFVGANSAPGGGVWGAPQLIYHNDGDGFNELQTGSPQLNGTTAMIRIHEGRFGAVQNGTRPIRIKGIPGFIPGVDQDIVWPSLVNGLVDPDRFVIDRGPVFGDSTSGLVAHISHRPKTEPLNVTQLINSGVPNAVYGSNNAIWWAWLGENNGAYSEYGVYANSMVVDPSHAGEWGTPERISGPSNTVGWPQTCAWPDGRIMAIWHRPDAPTGLERRKAVYQASMNQYGAAFYSPATDSWSAPTTFMPGGDLGRISDIRPVGTDEVLVFARLDDDGENQPNSSTDERALVSVRRMAFDASENLVESPSFPGLGAVTAPLVLAEGDNFPLWLGGYENGLSSGVDQLPLTDRYREIRNGVNRQVISAHPIDGRHFLVTWNGYVADPSETAKLFVSVLDSDTMTWLNNETLDLFQHFQNYAPIFLGQVISDIRLRVDRLGFATLLWSEGSSASSNRSSAVRSVRSTGSLIGMSLTDAFPTQLSSENVLARFVSNDPTDPDNLNSPSGGVYPVAAGLSNTDGSGHYAVSWARRYTTSPSDSSYIIIGTNSRRYR